VTIKKKMDGKNEIIIKVSEICYSIFFSILFFAKAIGLYDGQAAFKVCLVLAAGFVFIKIVLTEYDIRELLVSLFLIALGAIIYRNSGEKSALVFLVMMIGFKNIPMERIMKTGLAVWTVGFGGMVLTSMLGICNDVVMAHHKFGIDILRRGMGYTHPNVLHVSYAVLVVLILFILKEDGNRAKAYLWLFAGNIVIFMYSASYTGFLMVVFFITFHIYFTYRKEFTRVEVVIIQSIFPLCVLFSLFAPLLVEPGSTLFNILNKLLNNRFYASRLYLQENPLTLFGSRIYASHTYALDNSYVTLLIYGGTLLFLLVCAGYIWTVHASLKGKDVKALSVLLSFSIAGVIEPFLLNFSFKNLSLLIIAEYLFALCGNGRKIPLFSKWDREAVIAVPGNLQRFSRKPGQGKKVQALSFAAAILAGTCFFVAADIPETVYISEDNCCDVEGEILYVDPQGYENDGDIVFYGDIDKDKGVYKFNGNTMTYERVRDTVRLTFVVSLAGNVCLPYLAGKSERDK